MIVCTTEPTGGALLVHLAGTVDAGDDPVALVERIVHEAGAPGLIIDLSGLSFVSGPGVVLLLSALAHAKPHAPTVLVHPDLQARRTLRASACGMPVVPSTRHAHRSWPDSGHAQHQEQR